MTSLQSGILPQTHGMPTATCMVVIEALNGAVLVVCEKEVFRSRALLDGIVSLWKSNIAICASRVFSSEHTSILAAAWHAFHHATLYVACATLTSMLPCVCNALFNSILGLCNCVNVHACVCVLCVYVVSVSVCMHLCVVCVCVLVCVHVHALILHTDVQDLSITAYLCITTYSLQCTAVFIARLKLRIRVS